MNKRDFLRLSTAMMAGSMIPVRSYAKGILERSADPSADIKPIYRTLGKTGISVPVVSSGIIPQWDTHLVKAVFESGMRFFDSAWEYQNGGNDRMVGDMVRKMGREKFTVTTKILLPIDDKAGQYTKAATTKAFMDQLEVSLKRSKLGCVDILFLHHPPTRAALFNEEMMNGLRLAKEQGKALFVGFSNHSNQVELIDGAIESKFYDVVLVGYNFRQDKIVKPAIARAHEANLGVVTMKTFAGGNLDKEGQKPVNKSAALKWVLQDEHVHTVITTINNYEDLQINMAVMKDLTMTEQEKSDLAEAVRTPGMYCLGCEKCRPRCPRNLPIPDLMRAYMYTYGYRKPAQGRKVLDVLSLDDQPCADCPECRVKCTLDFDVSAKIKDIMRLRNVPPAFLT
jgi:uncharacterized protein